MITKELFIKRTIELINKELINFLPLEETLDIMVEKRNQILKNLMESH